MVTGTLFRVIQASIPSLPPAGSCLARFSPNGNGLYSTLGRYTLKVVPRSTSLLQ